MFVLDLKIHERDDPVALWDFLVQKEDDADVSTAGVVVEALYTRHGRGGCLEIRRREDEETEHVELICIMEIWDRDGKIVGVERLLCEILARYL